MRHVRDDDSVVHAWYGQNALVCGLKQDHEHRECFDAITCIACLVLPWCECPDWWFPPDRRLVHRTMKHDGALNHHVTCPVAKAQFL